MKKILFLLFFLTLNIFGNNIVLTSIQSVYSIAKEITKDTSIEVKSIFGSDVSMDYGKSAFDNVELDLSEAKDAVAVIDVAKVWDNDYLYEYSRRKNIRIVEIDASYSFSENDYLSLSLLDYKNNERNPYIWLSFQNGSKMAQIISKDLISLFPNEERKITENLDEFLGKLKEIDDYFLEKSLEFDSLSVITLTENLDYLFNDLNFFTHYVNFSEISVENIEKIMKKNNSKIFVSDKWLKKEVIKEIEKNGGKFIVLDTFNIPRDLDDEMDPQGYLVGMKENIEKIINILK